uniref:FDF domain-containing protein n=1 Tax=Angiostrongylus cantonensis TaxID=6313 RepID=A0A0K0DBP9_ANGCA
MFGEIFELQQVDGRKPLGRPGAKLSSVAYRFCSEKEMESSGLASDGDLETFPQRNTAEWIPPLRMQLIANVILQNDLMGDYVEDLAMGNEYVGQGASHHEQDGDSTPGQDQEAFFSLWRRKIGRTTDIQHNRS